MLQPARRRSVPALAVALFSAAALALCAVLLLGSQDSAAQVQLQRLKAGPALAGLTTQLYEEDDLSEAELAGRLSHAIDAHEKCRRHWPHLEKLEAAQEIRVHDARNNLEVSNRAMERARKELRDAEGLVLAARQEHQSYEAQRVAFQTFKSDYDQRTLAMKATDAVQLAQRTGADAQLQPGNMVQSDAQLAAESAQLELAQKRVMELESNSMAALKERTAEELAASMPARTQDLAQVPAGPRPILTTVRSGIVVPRNSELAKKEARKARVASANTAAKLITQEMKLKEDEVKAFAELPSEEKMVAEIKHNIGRQERRETVERSRMIVTRRRLRHLQRREADDELEGMARKVQLAKAQNSLAAVNLHITEHKIAQEKKEIATLKAEERAGPTDSEKLSEVKTRLKNLRRHLPTALAGPKARETELVQVDQVSAGKGKRGRTARAHGAAQTKVTTMAKEESRAQLRKEVIKSRTELKSIRNQLLAVQSRLAAQQQADPAAAHAVKQTLSTARHHDVKNSQQVLRDGNFQPTMALYNVYEEKLTALREERKKADGLLAKAERMLNIARIDSLHAAKTKKAALEELKYATSKLRRYQDLRSKSQHCQMDAVSAPRAPLVCLSV